jgi:protease-4
VSVTGTISEANDFVKRQLDRIRDDQSVKAVVLRINSPGGTVTYSDYLYHHVTKLCGERKLPVVVSMGSLCASGGYYIAMAAGDGDGNKEKVLFAEPTTWTGSIGVIIPHYDLSGLLAQWAVEDDSVKSHPLKDMGSPTKSMSDEERAILQALVDSTFGRFKEIVKAGRPQLAANEADLDAVATGQIFTAEQALKLGLVDELGFIEDAIDRAVQLAGKTSDTVRCVEYKSPPNLVSELIGVQSRRQSLGVETLLELSTPRAYYICTLLPAVLENSR